MKDKQISFALTDKFGKSYKFTDIHYCLQSNVSHVYVYYSVLEGVWTFILLNGWIKIDNKVLGSEPLYFHKRCTLVFDKKIYYFQSYMKEEDSASKILSEAISSADDKYINKSHANYFLKNIKKIDDVESYIKILMWNPIFEIGQDDVLKLNYFQYGMHRHNLIEHVLYYEFVFKANNGILFKIVNLESKEQSSEFIINNVVHYTEGCMSILEYVHAVTNNTKYETDTEENGIYQIYKNWIKTFFIFKDCKNIKKRKFENSEDLIIKKRCVYKEDKKEQVCTTIVYKENKELRNCFSAAVSNKSFIKKRNKTKRSHSLIEDRDEGNDKCWMFDKKSHDI